DQARAQAFSGRTRQCSAEDVQHVARVLQDEGFDVAQALVTANRPEKAQMNVLRGCARRSRPRGGLAAWVRDTQRGTVKVDGKRASEGLACVGNRIHLAERACERVADSSRVQWVPGMQSQAVSWGCGPEL